MTQLRGLISDANTILAAMTADSQGRFAVVCCEVDERGRPCIGPNWAMFTDDLHGYHGKDFSSESEAWDAVKPLFARLRLWGWKIVNRDMVEVTL